MAQLNKNTNVNIKATSQRFISYIVVNQNSTDTVRATPFYYIKSHKKWN